MRLYGFGALKRLTPHSRAYFKRFQGKGDWFDTGDAGVIDEQGYVSVLSRADDVIKWVPLRFAVEDLLNRMIALPGIAWAPVYLSRWSLPTHSLQNAV